MIAYRCHAARVALLGLVLAPLAAIADITVAVDSAFGPIKLEARDGGTVLMLRVPQGVDLEASSRALDALLGQLPPANLQHPRISIDMGRIVEHPWLSQRLAEAALASPRWDARRGRPRGESDNAAIAHLIDERQLAAPWAAVFVRHGFALGNASVEKVGVGRVGTTAELAPLASQPAAAGAKLPFDAILWLQLERTTP